MYIISDVVKPSVWNPDSSTTSTESSWKIKMNLHIRLHQHYAGHLVYHFSLGVKINDVINNSNARVQKTHHKFMRASYMKHFAKFLAILHHNASFFNFCFIINFGFIKNLLHILEILKYYCCLCHSATDCQ